MDEIQSVEKPLEKCAAEKPIVELTTTKKKNGKKLRKIRKQMEFYFSNANLQKDKMLGQMVQKDSEGYVDISIFLTFNKIRALTSDVQDVIEALSRSRSLQTNDDSTRVRRTCSFVPSDKGAKEETIYIERLPPHADRKFIRNVFQRFGEVVFVNLPYFRKTGKHKGFAFVEFVSTDCAQKACEAYKMYSDEESEVETETEVKKNGEAEETKKVTTKIGKFSSMKHSRKRKKSESSEKSPNKMSKSGVTFFSQKTEGHSKHQTQERAGHTRKRKRQTSEGEPNAKVRKDSRSSDLKTTNVTQDTVAVKCEANVTASEQKSIPPTIPGDVKCIDTKDKNTDTKVPELIDAIPADTSENVLVKCEADVVNNLKTASSLEESKNIVIMDKIGESTGDNTNNIEESKVVDGNDNAEVEMVKKKRRRRAHSDDKLKLRVLSMEEWITYRNRYLALQRKGMSAIKKMLLLDRQQRQECESLLCHEDEEKKASSSKTQFQKGLIVKVLAATDKTLPAPDELRKQIKSSVEQVAFVDTSLLAESKMYVRFINPDASVTATSNDLLKGFGPPVVLSGEEESLYWEKLEQDRTAQRNRPKVMKRGRDKVVARATKLAQRKKHIFFEK